MTLIEATNYLDLKMDNIEQRIIMSANRFIQIAKDRLGYNPIQFYFDFKLNGRCGGQFVCAIEPDNTIVNARLRFNIPMAKQDPELFLSQVVGHEVAHMVANAMFGSYDNNIGHGKMWKYVMMVFGLPAGRCHNFDVSPESGVIRRQHTKYATTCGCATHMISGQRKARLVAGVVYRCKHCRNAIKLV